jgi:glycosyltransferase involved in cell wall biosynthesis
MMKLSLVAPCFNEEGNVRLFTEEARRILADIEYEIVFINDGSRDGTLAVLKELYDEHRDHMQVINFSRNFGKEAGLYAGLQHAKGDYVVIIDTDLQQPIEVAREMVEFLDAHPEYDEVAAYQEERREGQIMTAFKSAFYKMINSLCDIELYANASDFRCMRRCVVEAILSMSEYHRFSKGIFAWIGFDTYYRPYEVRERNSGTTSWSFMKLVNYALEGVISFSTKPLKMVTKLGVTTSFLAIVYMVIVVIQKLAFGNPVPGYPTIIVLILLIGGIQLTVLGIIGEYLAKMHIEVKNRPIYVAKSVWDYEEYEEDKEDNVNRGDTGDIA